MRRKHVIYLHEIEETENDIGDKIQVPVKRKILAEKKSVRQSEFYQADATDLRPEIVFEVWSAEYKGESSLEFNKKDYNIIRTFDKDEKTVELICQGMTVYG